MGSVSVARLLPGSDEEAGRVVCDLLPPKRRSDALDGRRWMALGWGAGETERGGG